MVYIPRVRIEIYKAVTVGNARTYADDSSDPTYVIDDFTNLSIQFGTDRKKDKVSFNVLNHRELVDGKYQFANPNDFDLEIKDLVKIYAWNHPMVGTLSQNLILNGYIKSFAYSSEESAGVFNFTCFNRTEVLMNSFMIATFNEGESPPNIITETLGRVRTYNVNDIIYAYKDYTGETIPKTRGAYINVEGVATAVTGLNGRLGYIRAYKKGAYREDDSGLLKPEYSAVVPSTYHFPTKLYVETNKEMTKHLDTVSSVDYTEDDRAGAYLYWVDNSGNLHWEAKSFTTIRDGSEVTLNEDEWSKVTMSRDNDEVINAVIINCGTDPNQNGILAISFNASSMGKNGAKWKYLAKTGIAEKFREIEAKSGDLYIDGVLVVSTGDNSGSSIGVDNYPTSYPWTVQHSGVEPKNADWTYVAGTSTVITDIEFKTYYRRICILQGQIEGDFITKYHSEPLWRGTWESDIGRNNYVQNQMVNINLKSLNLSTMDIKYPLRVSTITHSFNQGWVTTLTIKEDIDYRNAISG